MQNLSPVYFLFLFFATHIQTSMSLTQCWHEGSISDTGLTIRLSHARHFAVWPLCHARAMRHMFSAECDALSAHGSDALVMSCALAKHHKHLVSVLLHALVCAMSKW